MSGQKLGVLVVVFVVSRIANVWLAGIPLNVGAATGDIAAYSSWAHSVAGQDLTPYSEVRIEYPPGVIPFLVTPEEVQVGGDDYRSRFVLLMLLVDVAGFIGLLFIARRTGMLAGPLVWTLGGVLLGPIIYLRLDIIPAVATIWAVERSAASRWSGSGALFGFGVAAKLYPALLLPIAFLTSPKRRQLVIGVAVVVAGVLLVYGTVLPELWDSVIGYHTERGVHMESTWGAFLLAISKRGYEATVVHAFGSLQIESSVSGSLKGIANILSLAALVAGTWIVGRYVTRGDVGRATTGMYGLLATTMAVGTVLSPQFVIWLIALAAAALCFTDPGFRSPLFLVLPLAGLTQAVFPHFFSKIVVGEPWAIVLLMSRNMMLLGIGLSVLVALLPEREAVPAPPA